MYKALIVEDMPDKMGILRSRLDRIGNIHVETAMNYNEAVALINSKIFDIAFVDLSLRPHEDLPGALIFEGIQLGEDIRKHSATTVIVMYSAHIDPKQPKNFMHLTECKNAGADEVMPREMLLSLNSKDLGATMRGWINAKRSISASARPFDHEKDWHTLALLEYVGNDIVVELIHKLIPDMENDKIKALTAGYSGATVLHVVSSIKDNKKDVETVVKITRNPYVLSEELRNRPVIGTALDQNAIIPHTNIAECGGWYGIATRYVKNAVLLKDFLLEAIIKRGDEKILATLVNEILVEPARVAIPQTSGIIKLPSLLGLNAGVQMLDALNQMRNWGKIISPKDVKEIIIVYKYIEFCLNGHWTICDNFNVARLHGDLHCNNIFIHRTGRPILIDTARSEYYPRLMDFATLNIDLVISVLDATNGLDMIFKNVPAWFELVLEQFPFTKVVHRKKRTRYDILQTQLLNQMKNELEHITQIEYAEAILFQLLRYIKFQNTTGPKKLLAVKLAAKIIETKGLSSIK